MVMVAGNHQHRAGDGGHHLQHLHHRGGGDGRGIEEISCYQQRISVLPLGVLRDPADRFDPRLLQSNPLLLVFHPAERLADLPVGRMQQTGQGKR